jgi:hypothetical protein
MSKHRTHQDTDDEFAAAMEDEIARLHATYGQGA